MGEKELRENIELWLGLGMLVLFVVLAGMLLQHGIHDALFFPAAGLGLAAVLLVKGFRRLRANR